MEDDLLHMGLGVGDDAGASHFRTRSSRRRHRDDRCDPVRIGTRPPVANIFKVPDRPRLPCHEGDSLAEIETRAAAESHDAIMPAILEGLHTGLEIDLVRVRIDVGEDRAAKSGLVENIQRMAGDRHPGKTTIRDQKWLLDAERLAGIRQFLDAATPELDGGRIAPVCDDVHFVTFFRWYDFGRVRFWKPMTESEPPRPVSLTPVQQSAGSR